MSLTPEQVAGLVERLREYASHAMEPIAGDLYQAATSLLAAQQEIKKAADKRVDEAEAALSLCRRSYDGAIAALEEATRRQERLIAGNCLKCGIGPHRETCAYPEACEHPGRVTALDLNQALLSRADAPDAVVELLRNPPSAERFHIPEDWYQYWWALLLKAAGL